jgi:hypothetical protein
VRVKYIREITLKFFVNSNFNQCSAADSKKFPLQPTSSV